MKGGWFPKDEKARNYRCSCGAFRGRLLGLVFLRSRNRDPSSSESDRLLLLVPDGTNFSDPSVTVWTDAASEEGLHIVPIHDSTFLQPLFGRPPCAGVIFPDSIHLQANDILIGAIREYVAGGGSLMLVYDAGTKSQEGRYVGDQVKIVRSCRSGLRALRLAA